MNYKITHTTTYAYSDIVPVCHNEVHLAPRDGIHQTCRYHRLLIKPVPSTAGKRLDYFGNQLHHFSIHEGHRKLILKAISKVEVRPHSPPPACESPPWDSVGEVLRCDLRPAALEAIQFIFDSSYVRRSPEITDYARPSFPPDRPILEAVLDLTNRIHGDFRYDSKATTVHTPLEEVLRLRAGVCQDFAHVEIGCLRSLGLPARYVSGYLRTLPPPGRPRLVGADASHAWLAVYCGPLGWVDVDPTNDVLPTTDHITVAWGRDYGDVCPIEGVFVGGGKHEMSVAVDVVPVGNLP
jgi:transglutaminase-like putative cysteine protease